MNYLKEGWKDAWNSIWVDKLYRDKEEIKKRKRRKMDKVGSLCLWRHRRGLPTFIHSYSIMDKAGMRAPRGFLPQKDTHSKIPAEKGVVLLPFC